MCDIKCESGQWTKGQVEDLRKTVKGETGEDIFKSEYNGPEACNTLEVKEGVLILRGDTTSGIGEIGREVGSTTSQYVLVVGQEHSQRYSDKAKALVPGHGAIYLHHLSATLGVYVAGPEQRFVLSGAAYTKAKAGILAGPKK